jgi:hypothetical protein
MPEGLSVGMVRRVVAEQHRDHEYSEVETRPEPALAGLDLALAQPLSSRWVATVAREAAHGEAVAEDLDAGEHNSLYLPLSLVAVSIQSFSAQT